MNRSLSDPAVYGGGIQEHRRHRGSFETSGELLSRISQKESEARKLLYHPLHRTAQGNILLLGFLPTQLEESLSRRKVLLGEAYQGTASHAQTGSPDHKSPAFKTGQGGKAQGGVKLENPANLRIQFRLKTTLDKKM